MESNPVRLCELLVGLPAVSVLDVVSRENEPLRVHVERLESVAGCPVCVVVAHVKDRRRVELVDRPPSGARPAADRAQATILLSRTELSPRLVDRRTPSSHHARP